MNVHTCLRVNDSFYLRFERRSHPSVMTSIAHTHTQLPTPKPSVHKSLLCTTPFIHNLDFVAVSVCIRSNAMFACFPSHPFIGLFALIIDSPNFPVRLSYTPFTAGTCEKDE